MGGGVSIETSQVDLATHVSGLGNAYEPYAKAIADNGIDGKMLLDYENVDTLLTDLNLEANGLHKKKLNSEFQTIKSAAQNPSHTGTGFDTAALDALVELAKTIVVKEVAVNDDDINHCFISYRQKTEKQFSTILYMGVKALAVDEEFAYPDCKPKLFLDTKSLRDGEDWEVGFVRGLLASQMMVPLVSWHAEDNGSVAQMIGFSEANDYQDNVLLEWELALALREWEGSLLKAIFPVLIADKDDRGFLSFPFQNFGKLSTLPSIKTKAKLVQICVANGIPLSEKAVRRGVKDVIAEITQNQGIKMSDLGAEEVAMGSCEKRVFDKAAELARLALEEYELKNPYVSTATRTTKKVIDAVVEWSDTTAYFFKGDKYLKYDISTDTAGAVNLTSAGWTAEGFFTEGIDTACMGSPGEVYFFRKDEFITYNIAGDFIQDDDGNAITEPQKILDNWPEGMWTDIDAAVNWGNGRIYFFKGDEYLRYDIAKDCIDNGYPQKIGKGWGNTFFSSDIDSAVNWGNGKVYFFSGEKYLRFDIESDRVDSGYPQLINESNWPGLPSLLNR